MGAVAVGATIYFGSPESARQIVEVAQAFKVAHEMGLATVLWCYLRNPGFKKDKDYHVSADLTGQANHLGRHDRGRHHQAEAAREQRRLQRDQLARRTRTARSTSGSTPSSPATTRSTCAATRWPTATWAAPGSSTRGGASGENDFAEAVKTAVINKRAGGMGLISGRKAFQRPMAEGVKLLNTIQDVYLCKDVTIA